MWLFKITFVAVLGAIVTGCFGADLNSSDFFNDPHLRELADAAADGNVRRIDKLLASGVQIEGKGRLDVTPAWWAIRKRNFEGFAHMLEKGANPNADVQSYTIPELAAGYDDSRFLELLIARKANLNQPGTYSRGTAINVAIANRKTHNLQLLIDAGADLNAKGGGGDRCPIFNAIFSLRYDYVYMLLKAGADPRVTGSNGSMTIQGLISSVHINANSDAYVWRERVIRFLESKGIHADRPNSGEGSRTDPVPPDLR